MAMKAPSQAESLAVISHIDRRHAVNHDSVTKPFRRSKLGPVMLPELGQASGLRSTRAGVSARLGRWLPVLLFGMMSWQMLVAQEFHVNGSLGADTAAGDQAHPWRTINHAAAVAVAGDTVVIHAGTYALAGQLAFAHSGRAGLPIRYMAKTGDIERVDGGAGYCMSLQFRSYLVFQGLRFTTSSTAVGAGMVNMEGTNFCEFLGCTFSDMPAEVGAENTAAIRCMQTEVGQSVGCVFRNNLFTNCRAPAMRLYDTDGWIIEHNEFVNCSQAVGGKDQPNNMMVRYNRITDGTASRSAFASTGSWMGRVSPMATWPTSSTATWPWSGPT